MIGVEGCGCGAIEHMVRAGLEGVDFIGADTDGYTLGCLSEATAIQLPRTLISLDGAELGTREPVSWSC